MIDAIQIDAPVLSVTLSAVTVIRNLLTEREIPNHALRVFVSGGGCSGMQYGMAFEESPRDYDRVVEVDGVRPAGGPHQPDVSAGRHD